MKDPSNRFTKAERSWILYDWANSAHTTVIVAAILPIYFAAVAGGQGVNGDIWWGYGTSLATFAAALLAPLLGSVGDYQGMKKRLFTIFLGIALFATLLIALVDDWRLMLVGYVLSYFSYTVTNLFYDSFLTDVTTPDRMDRVSTYGYGFGYIGGSTIPFIVAIAMIQLHGSIGITNSMAVKLSILLTVAWWFLFSLPMIRNVHQVHFDPKPAHVMQNSFSRIARTFLGIMSRRAMFLFMLAYFFYIDGVNTVIHMATSYGAVLGLDTTGMILALLVTQLVAFPFAILFGRLARVVGAVRMISIAIAVYTVICLLGFYMGHSLETPQGQYIEGFRNHIQAKAAIVGVARFESEASQQAFTQMVDDTVTRSVGPLSSNKRADLFADRLDERGAEARPAFADRNEGDAFDKALEAVRADASAYLADTARAAPLDRAVAFSTTLFWILAALVGTCQGGIQALSRSFFGKLVPPEKSNEYFGFFDIFGKFAAVLGPALYGVIAGLTGRSSYGILSVIALFLIGGVFMFLGRKDMVEAERRGREQPA